MIGGSCMLEFSGHSYNWWETFLNTYSFQISFPGSEKELIIPLMSFADSSAKEKFILLQIKYIDGD